VWILFGKPLALECEWTRQFSLNITKPRTKAEILADLDELEKKSVKELTIYGIPAVEFLTEGMYEEDNIEIMGKKHNYAFNVALLEENARQILLEQIQTGKYDQ
jgi:hypothetical protein